VTLPNFLIIGAAKAGTTSLYEYLRQHPDVYLSPLKEPRYYSDPPLCTRDEYLRLFDGVRGERAIGEASPQYLPSETAPDRIAADLPEVKLIATLRNPADRAYSSYLGRIRGGSERRGVDETMRRGSYYFETSLYAQSLSRYYARFPRERIKVVLLDDLASDPRALTRGIFEFLGVDADFEPDLRTRHNESGIPAWQALYQFIWKSAAALQKFVPPQGLGIPTRLSRRLLRKPPPLPRDVRERMLDEFRDDIAATGRLIGRDLSHWLATAPAGSRSTAPGC